MSGIAVGAYVFWTEGRHRLTGRVLRVSEDGQKAAVFIGRDFWPQFTVISTERLRSCR